ncbi:hypothetical protein D9758_009684 [Tetrapyrgos nigripes]|uniref:Uncharacterized protein n=1 Tax=Tetrapyrgos nigripes TaxID=182062 RepID=A0A8H5FQ97_9AGAR|nr:hypothetical protein D9758_009684 [Tetrapyrgos nigripes]
MATWKIFSHLQIEHEQNTAWKMFWDKHRVLSLSDKCTGMQRMALQALTHLEQVRVQFEQLGRRLELGRCLFFLARTYQEHPALAPDSLSIALRLANEALDIFRQHEDKQYSAALRTALQALDSAKSLGDSNGVSQALYQNGDILFRMGDYEGAQDALRKSLIALEGVADSSVKTWTKEKCNEVLAMIEEQSRSTYCNEEEAESEGESEEEFIHGSTC